MENFDENTIPPRRVVSAKENNDTDLTVPGIREKRTALIQAGDLIKDRYKVLAELGHGGMGVVYRCFDEVGKIEVAVKTLPPELSRDALEMEDIKDNFQLVANLVHQYIANIKNLERDQSSGIYYLIMEYCPGEDLRSWIRRKRKQGALVPEEVIGIVKQAAAALDYAHEKGVIHRDIKPGNIIIDPAGRIKILDFGLAARIHSSMSRVSMAYNTSGTGSYMAPEQWEGKVQDAKADQYALAVMTYEMLGGHLPFDNPDTLILREAVLRSQVSPLTCVPDYMNKALIRALGKTPGERFNSCSAFAAALEGMEPEVEKVREKGWEKENKVNKIPDETGKKKRSFSLFKWGFLILLAVLLCLWLFSCCIRESQPVNYNSVPADVNRMPHNMNMNFESMPQHDPSFSFRRNGNALKKHVLPKSVNAEMQRRKLEAEILKRQNLGTQMRRNNTAAWQHNNTSDDDE